MKDRLASCLARGTGLLARIARDRAGNTLMLVAAGLVPLLALVGSGVDLGRSYLAQSRLQQACDAGVLAARKRLGTSAAVDGEVPDDVAQTGQRFFNINFRNQSYGTEERSFVMTLEEDFAISGTASLVVPTAVMNIFGFDEVPVVVRCEAQLTANNTDVMMVLDVTGSMALTNPGDSVNRMEAMKATIRSFHAQLSSAVSGNSRLRFGFVPYSTNVNVGHLLADDWVVDEWDYQSRKWIQTGSTISTQTYNRNWQYVSGSAGAQVTISSYPATWHPPIPGGGTYVDENENVVVNNGSSGYYTCDTPPPAGTYSATDVLERTETFPFAGPPAGTQTVQYRRYTENGKAYSLSRSGSTCTIRERTYDNYVRTYERVTEPVERATFKWQYKQFRFDVSDWRTASNGCIEERDTYEIDDYSAVNLSKALDLDIDRVPSGSDATKWRPMFPSIVYARSMKWDGTGSFTKPVQVTTADFVNPQAMGVASCPARARKLAPMTSDELNAYLGSLVPTGLTYHDIGMIWGGRLISPRGLFAGENADVSATQPTSRHLIFLTDGETAPLDFAYSSYGLEPLDGRRWDQKSAYSLQQTIENRFAFACSEVRKRNVTVWVIGFGTTLNPIFKECAGESRYFEADDADELTETFAKIAKRMAELRIVK